ncbi:MAG: S8 family serine peptidase [Nocardioidaceae bacterium]
MAAGLLACTGSLALGSPARAAENPGPARSTEPGVYVVTLTTPPAASYAGRHPGFRATRPAPGHRFDRTRPAVGAYDKHLRDLQDRVLAEVGNPEVVYRYSTALDGFAAMLDTQQVKQLRTMPAVARVERDTRQQVATTGGAVPGVASSGGVASRDIWAAEGGPAGAGRGTVIGVLDTGIWPENPSFAGLPQKTPGRAVALPGFHGSCAAAERWSAHDCNDKVVSARWFVRGFGANHLARSDYLSARDGSGHGTHSASTAAGDHGVRVRIGRQRFGTLSGLAPAARIAVYKACWTAPDPSQDGCTTSDTVAAIDAATADGVDVLNYSVAGSGDPADSVSRAFLGAASAHVFVAAAAGNDGATRGAVRNVGPWVTTVGASTRRSYRGQVVLGDGTRLDGAMVSTRTVRARRLVLGRDVPAPGAGPPAAGLCEVGSLDAAKTEGRVVVCDRGVTARVAKSAAVARAGGVGMVLANTRPGSVDADVHSVPTVQVGVTEARTLKRYVAAAGRRATARLVPGGEHTVPVPAVAGFSSRGPAPAAGGALLKPDLTAPGVSVLGAVAPVTDFGRQWDLESGTSASAPHVAGVAADVRGAHPRWSAARVKSALMTSAQPLAGGDGAFAGGAGHVDPLRAVDPGLTFDSGPRTWRRFLDGRLPAQDLNLPSVAVGRLVGRTQVVRRVTNVSGRTETYDVRVTGLPGIDAMATPARITLAPGQTRPVTLLLAARSVDGLNRYAKGSLTLSGPHLVRVPVVVRPRALAAPRQVSGSGDTGATVVRGRAGTSSQVLARSTGLVGAAPTGVSLVPGGFDTAAPSQDESTMAMRLHVPAGAVVARAQIAADDRADDLDLYVYRGDTLVASATSSAANATVTLFRPAAGEYTVYVNAHQAAGAASTGRLYTWVVGHHAGAPLTLTPAGSNGLPGRGFAYTASWRHLDPAKRWLGVVRYGRSGDATLVQVR